LPLTIIDRRFTEEGAMIDVEGPEEAVATLEAFHI
jgi:hypothetical protein